MITPPADRDVTVAPNVLVRIAGLPFSTILPLSGGRTAEAASRLDAIERGLAPIRDALCQSLHDAVAGLQDAPLRNRLIALKRAVFNDRLDVVRGLLASPSALGEVRPSWREGLEAWLEARAEADSLRERGERELDRTFATARTILGALWGDQTFRTSVAASNPGLFRNLDRELSTGPRTARGLGKAEMTLLAYGYRSATKLSPFGAFTRIGFGRVGETGHGSGPADVPPCESRFFLQAGVLQSIVGTLMRWPPFQDALPLRLNPTVELSAESTDSIDCRCDGVGPAARETHFSASRHPILDVIVQALSEAQAVVPQEELERQICSGFSAPPDAIASLVAKLRRACILLPTLEFDANDAAALRRLRDALPGSFPELRGRVEAIEAELAGIDAFAPETVVGAAERIGRIIVEIAAGTGETSPPPDEHHIIGQECFQRGELTIPDRVSSTLRHAFRRIAGILPLFNTEFPTRTLLAGRFLDRRGHAGHADHLCGLFRQLGPCDPDESSRLSEAEASRMPLIAEWAGARLRLVGELAALIADDSVGHVPLPDAFLVRWGEQAHPYRSKGVPASLTCMGQWTEGDGERGFVVNKLMAGYGMILAHWADREGGHPGWQALASGLEESLAALCPDAEAAELVGTFGFDGQIRPRLTRRCLHYPGEAVGPSQDSAIPLSSLGARYEPEWGRVICFEKSSGRTVIPIHLGTLTPLAFPPFYRFLKAFGPNFAPDLPLLELFERHLPDGPRARIRRYPRIFYEGVVLLRRSWCVPPEFLPCPGGGSGLESYRSVRRWALDLGLPRHTFVTPTLTGELLRRGPEVVHPNRLRKPFYVDWDSPCSHEVFRRYTRARGATVVISEMLPTFESAAPFGSEGRLDELVFELSWQD